MKNNWRLCGAVAIAGLFLCRAGIAAAQSGAAAGASASSSANKSIGRDTSPTNPENALELIRPPDSREESAFRSFQAVSPEDPKKRIELGEAFLKKYPASQYQPPIYSALTAAYLQTNQVQKMEEAGEKDLELNPKDVHVLAMLGQTLPRTITPSTPEPDKRLDKAEQYSKRAIEGALAMKKSEGLTSEEFERDKNRTLAIAHSGLGLVNLRRGNYTGAIEELEQSVKLDPKADPVNYYVLGVAHHNASHFREAAAAFSKCAEFQGAMQAMCKDNAGKDANEAATQTISPK
jgi:tetratricopeptide (TPR) repeat protein